MRNTWHRQLEESQQDLEGGTAYIEIQGDVRARVLIDSQGCTGVLNCNDINVFQCITVNCAFYRQTSNNAQIGHVWLHATDPEHLLKKFAMPTSKLLSSGICCMICRVITWQPLFIAGRVTVF